MGMKNWFTATLLSSFTRNNSLQALYPVEIFFFQRGGLKLLWFYNLGSKKVLVWLQKREIKWSRVAKGLGRFVKKKKKSIIIDQM